MEVETRVSNNASATNYHFIGFIGVAGDNVDCWMEIQHGKGPWAPPVSGIVPLGSTLTLVVAINDYRGNGGEQPFDFAEKLHSKLTRFTLLHIV